MAVIGQQLTVPESGWKRIEDSTTGGYLAYDATIQQANDGLASGGFWRWTKDIHKSLTFSFYGSKIRVIGVSNSDRATDVQITIDGVTETFSQRTNDLVFRCLNYEKTDLTLGKHMVTITSGSNGSYNLGFDAVDIDEDGYLTFSIGQQLTTAETGWKRIEQSDPYILFNGTFANSGSGNAMYRYSTSLTTQPTINILMYSDKLRIIARRQPTATYAYTTNAELVIDGEVVKTFSYAGPDQTQTLVAEITGLSFGFHQVQIRAKDNDGHIQLDAIDIDISGHITAQVGQTLSQPEVGWRRYDDRDRSIKYTGTQTKTNNSAYFGNTATGLSPDGSVEFRFIGSKLRMIEFGSGSRSQNIEIMIDGTPYTFSGGSGSGANYKIIWQKLDLPYGEHKVTMRTLDGIGLVVDAFDIDETGVFYPGYSSLFQDGTEVKRYINGEWEVVGQIPLTEEMFYTYGMWETNTIPTEKLNLLASPKLLTFIDRPFVTQSKITGVPVPRLIKSTGNLSFSEATERVYQPALTASEVGSGKVRVLLSNNDGLSWKTLGELVKPAIPKMTTATNGSVTVSADSLSGSSYVAWKAFTRSLTGTSYWQSANTNVENHWLKVDFGETKTIRQYSITSILSSRAYDPHIWNLEGSNDDVNWDVLDYRNESTWLDAETKYYQVANPKPYRYYRLNIQKAYEYLPNGTTTWQAAITDFQMWENVLQWKDVNITNMNAVESEGMTIDILPYIQVTDLYNETRKLRFAYYLAQDTTTDVASTDKITIKTSMKGYWKKAKVNTDYKAKYLDKVNLEVRIITPGDFKINYVGD